MSVAVQRPQRWDTPFGTEMRPEHVSRLLQVPPFANIDTSRFPAHCSLHDVLLNDSRIVEYEPGDLIVREGDYGDSAFYILKGTVRVSLQSLPTEMLGRKERPRKGWLRAVRSILRGASVPEVREYGSVRLDSTIASRQDGAQTRIFLQDVPGVLDEFNTLPLSAGEFFGEGSALSRGARSATVFAETKCVLLELRWQGLRELIRRDPATKEHVHELYRQNRLLAHLRETPLLQHVDEGGLESIRTLATFESHGSFEWHASYRRVRNADHHERLKNEPIIAEEGQPAEGLLLVTSGFARLSRQYGSGHLTMAYLGKGQQFGLDELLVGWKRSSPIALQQTLRAVGYVDVLRIPLEVLAEHVFPTLPVGQWKSAAKAIDRSLADRRRSKARPHPSSESELSTGLLEFVVENRLMNGTQAMIIDTDRCTRCDDCVRACATQHDNNPRFIRHGPQYQNLMLANACMHCVDPVCMIGCPTGAIAREVETGNVGINDLTCIGCSTCANSCPYNNIRMVEVRTPSGEPIVDSESKAPIVKATKCDLCADHWGGPACQRACAHDALVRIDMNDIPALSKWLER